MRQLVILFLAIVSLGVVSLRAATGGDPGDLFVNAYMAVQQGEKLEQGGNFKQALVKFRYAAGVLDQLASGSPSWQPQIVSYRKSRTTEAIVRVQEKIARFGSGKTEPTEPPAGLEPPPLPQADNDKPLIFESPDAILSPSTSPSKTTAKSAPRRTTGENLNDDPIEELAQRMKKLQVELRNAKDEAERLQGEKADIARKLDEAAKAREASEQKQQLLQKRADNAEQALMKAVGDGKADAEKVKELRAEMTAAKSGLRDLKIEAEADAEYRQQLDDRYRSALNKIAALTQERDAANKASSDVPGKIADIQKQLDATRKERDDLATKLQKTEGQLVVVQQQRDEALTQVAKLREAQKQVDKLVADNTSLMAKLADAEKMITSFKAEGAQKDQEIAALKKEVGTVKEQLAAAKQESADYQRQMADLQVKLEESGKQLAAAKAENAASAAEKKKMQEENGILRGIVLRQQKEEAVRSKTRKLLLGEMANLEINSKTLLKQIELLSQPVVKLTEKEKALFKTPELQVSDTEISLGMSKAEEAVPAPAPEPLPTATPPAPSIPNLASVPPPPVVTATPVPTPVKAAATPPPVATIAIPATPEPQKAVKTSEPPLPIAETTPALTLGSTPATGGVGPLAMSKTPTTNSLPTAPVTPAPEAPAKTEATEAPASAPLGDSSGVASSAPNVPAELLPLAREGKEFFDRGNYLEAEKTYRKILAKVPNNLYALSNLGVVLFRAAKYKPAEDTFKKAIAVAPEDGFSHCTLGIVYYSQGKYDEAVNELTKALALNPKNATAHNYLGITASQKGWQEAAQKELETATDLDPNYADAHFNLAVVFAMQTPPNKENARKYYKRATELGAEPDSALEQLIK